MRIIRLGCLLCLAGIVATTSIFAQPSSALLRMTVYDPALVITPTCADQHSWPDDDDVCLACDSNGCAKQNVHSLGGAVDALGWVYTTRSWTDGALNIPPKSPCGNGEVPRNLVFGKLSPGASSTFETLIVFEGICENVLHPQDGVAENVALHIELTGKPLLDMVNGTLRLPVQTTINFTWNSGIVYVEPVLVSGLPTLFDVLVTYDPTVSQVSFNVPRYPEGQLNTTSFSVVSGLVEELPLLSEATAIGCDLPGNGPPTAGSRIEVADPFSDPQQGEARYYLSLAHQGQDVRAGRERIAGVLQARDGSQVPGCQGGLVGPGATNGRP